MLKERRILTATDLRNLCIEENFYTKGNTDEYNEILSFADGLENVTTEDIETIAMNIMVHSNTDINIRTIAYLIGRKCITFFD